MLGECSVLSISQSNGETSNILLSNGLCCCLGHFISSQGCCLSGEVEESSNTWVGKTKSEGFHWDANFIGMLVFWSSSAGNGQNICWLNLKCLLQLLLKIANLSLLSRDLLYMVTSPPVNWKYLGSCSSWNRQQASLISYISQVCPRFHESFWFFVILQLLYCKGI